MLPEKVASRHKGLIIRLAAQNKKAQGCPICQSDCDCFGWATVGDMRKISHRFGGRIHDLRHQHGWRIDLISRENRNNIYHFVGKEQFQPALKMGTSKKEVYIGTAAGIEFFEVAA